MENKIYYCQITYNRLRETIKSVNAVLPYVDEVIVIDGGSVDDTIVYMRNWEKIESKIKFFVCRWQDNFPKQRNKYLEKIQEGWAVVSDPDEIFPESTAKEFRTLTKLSDCDGFAFRARDITLRGEEVVSDTYSDFHKPLMFRVYGSDTRYDENRNPHETLIRLSGAKYNFRQMSELEYQHIKQQDVIWVRGARNFFIGGGGMNLGANNGIWLPFRELVFRKTRIKTWDDFYKYLTAGSIDKEIKDWMVRHMHEDGYDGASEVREMYKCYFRIFHPEEEPEELKGISIR